MEELTDMKRTIILIPIFGIMLIGLLSGCGASKAYVDQSIAGERARSETAIEELQGDVSSNKAMLEQMQSLTSQLEKKADLAINEAKGFENYQVIWEGEIFFDYDSFEITVAASEILGQGGDKMTTNRSAVMEISGYTDPTGSASYNLQLGRNRAAAAKYYLVENYGVNLYRIFMLSHGETKAVEISDGNVSYGKQRKVKLRLWGKL